MTRREVSSPKNGIVGWACPSNIALIKYWGKRPIQIPKNPSLSLSLTEARTNTTINYNYHPGNRDRNLQFRFEGKEAPTFEERIRKYINSLIPLMPLLSNTSLEIDSENTFPHSSGIASSASAMGALALCLVQLEEELLKTPKSDKFWEKASNIARLGSGSAARSVYPQFALWGEAEGWDQSSNQHAIPVSGFHETFLNLRDSILIVESGQKKVSSSAGHALMETNPFAKTRFKQARQNLELLHTAMNEGDWDGFIAIMEEEALSLHALMMTGKPGYLLMHANTLSIIKKIREFRTDSKLRLGFTLDAGANVHLLYADSDKEPVETFIHSHLVKHCEKGKVIKDKMGPGPQKIST